MREKRTVQTTIFHLFADHTIGRELQTISDWLDAHPEVLDWVEADLCPKPVQAVGRKGISVESVLRCALLKQYRQVSYDELAFYLLDSYTFQAFARLPLDITPKKGALQQQISRISASTWEQINHQLLVSAETDRLERGQVIRLDSTAIDAPIHAPTDSSLLWDGVRVLARLFDQAQAQVENSRLPYQNHSRKAKQLARSLVYTRGKDKKARLYIDWLKLTQKSLSYIDPVYQTLKHSSADLAQTLAWYADITHYRGLIKRVMSQTIRRVCDGEKVPAQDKIFSVFEDHTDIIVKGSRDIQYGHKLNLMTGQSGLVLDGVIETGNPADTERFIPMLDRHIEHYGRVPRQIAADGGYASVPNLNDAQAKGVKDVAFHKKKGLSVGDMTRSDWVYRKLRNFRAGIEAGISYLKRSFGLGRCTWKGLAHFKSYVWASVVTHNLVTLARLKLA